MLNIPPISITSSRGAQNEKNTISAETGNSHHLADIKHGEYHGDLMAFSNQSPITDISPPGGSDLNDLLGISSAMPAGAEEFAFECQSRRSSVDGSPVGKNEFLFDAQSAPASGGGSPLDGKGSPAPASPHLARGSGKRMPKGSLESQASSWGLAFASRLSALVQERENDKSQKTTHHDDNTNNINILDPENHSEQEFKNKYGIAAYHGEASNGKKGRELESHITKHGCYLESSDPKSQLLYRIPPIKEFNGNLRQQLKNIHAGNSPYLPHHATVESGYQMKGEKPVFCEGSNECQPIYSGEGSTVFKLSNNQHMAPQRNAVSCTEACNVMLLLDQGYLKPDELGNYFNENHIDARQSTEAQLHSLAESANCTPIHYAVANHPEEKRQNALATLSADIDRYGSAIFDQNGHVVMLDKIDIAGGDVIFSIRDPFHGCSYTVKDNANFWQGPSNGIAVPTNDVIFLPKKAMD